jgi:hypothetical protein
MLLAGELQPDPAPRLPGSCGVIDPADRLSLPSRWLKTGVPIRNTVSCCGAQASQAKEDSRSRCPERFVPGEQAAGSAGVGSS